MSNICTSPTFLYIFENLASWLFHNTGYGKKCKGFACKYYDDACYWHKPLHEVLNAIISTT